ncbi:MAG: 16S rRNA (cytosine(967)-C(5))-methyltransferase RsmB [Clostridia bacterium]|nr:16S rRNA (cytosine(967)-C(5))-methyltransferase RsmB [Clostridia bacterium]
MTPRQLAHTLLQRVETNDQFLNLALDHALLSSDLSDQDRRLCAALVYGVTERRITLDYQIARLSSRSPDSLDLSAKTALRLGLYQLIYMDRIPPHAAINESVSLVGRKASGFVNAVLRAYTRDPGLRLPERGDDPVFHLSVTYSVGLPLVRKLCDAYGIERTESVLRAFCEAEPLTTLSVNTLAISREALAERLPSPTPTEYSPVGLSVRGAVRSLYGFEEGLFFVQDEASQLCVEALGAEPGETIMDICSCPGSKSFGSAIRMQNRGRILAFDLHAKKLPLIESGAKRLGITIISPAVRDGRDPLPEWFERADRVLCDVPCSGFGVLAKKPELRYKDPAASHALPDIQLAILENACRYVKSGGVLVYSTCTIFPEENENNIARFLERHPEFSLSPFHAGELPVPRGYETLLPDTHPTDGFFIARMIRA